MSPTRLAGRIKAAVFLAAGGEDDRAPIQHSRRMEQALKAAEAYGLNFECEFKHHPDRLEGVFWKWVPAI